MNLYIGTKLIKARPMTRAEYNDYHGWELPADENGADEGFLVEYLNGGKSNHPNHEGYISWSPADVFPYEPTDGMSFGLAIEAMRMGKKVARPSWNGKGMFLFLVAADAWSYETDMAGTDGLDFQPFIAMKTAQDKIVPWLASQSDMLDTDWVIVG